MVSLPIRQDLSAAELRDLARKESDARVSRRLLGLAMALDGIGRGEAARQAGMDRQALRDWVMRYNAEGIDGLRDRGRSGRPALLAPELEEELRHLIEAGDARRAFGKRFLRRFCYVRTRHNRQPPRFPRQESGGTAP